MGTLGLWVLELLAMDATDGQTDGRTKATLIAPFPTAGVIITVGLTFNFQLVRNNYFWRKATDTDAHVLIACRVHFVAVE